MAKDTRVRMDFRVAPLAREWIDWLAEQHDTDRSTVIRHALAIAKKHEAALSDRLASAAADGTL